MSQECPPVPHWGAGPCTLSHVWRTVLPDTVAQEIRFRHRYLDMLVNPGVVEVFERRANVMKAIRRYFESRGFVEVRVTGRFSCLRQLSCARSSYRPCNIYSSLSAHR